MSQFVGSLKIPTCSMFATVFAAFSCASAFHFCISTDIFAFIGPKSEILEQDVVYFSRKEIDQAAMIVFYGYVHCVWRHIMYLKNLALIDALRLDSLHLLPRNTSVVLLLFSLFLLCLLEMLGSLEIFGFLEVLGLLVYDALHIYLDCRG